ncbi:MAG: hypothetical protein LBD78_07430 [Spirochaetaceae bacterium]|jgi:hypothetical protein|nr:hypothetical protein [Spirochaetaceae bacterium]
MGLLSKAMIKHSHIFPGKLPGTGSLSGSGKAPASPKRISLADAVTAYMQGKRCQGIVLDKPEDAKDDLSLRIFYSQLSRMLGKLGASFRLPSKGCLVLSPIPLDRELVGHRLAHSLHTSVLIDFEANTPGAVFKQITPYLL